MIKVEYRATEIDGTVFMGNQGTDISIYKINYIGKK